MRPFEVTTPNTAVNLGPAGTTAVTFSVSNVAGRALRANFIALADDATKSTWLKLGVAPSYDFTTESALTQVPVTIAAPAGATPGTFTFKLRALSAERPDDDFTDSPTVAFTLGPVAEKAPFPWWAIAVAIAIVLLAGGVAVGVRACKPVAVATPAPVKTPCIRRLFGGRIIPCFRRFEETIPAVPRTAPT